MHGHVRLAGVRTLRLVGFAQDGAALVLECDGEHFQLPIDAALRAAVTNQAPQLAIPFEAVPSAREIQQRIRRGDTVEDIAAEARVPVERIARYEGPPMADRAHQAELARTADSDGRPLGDRVAAALMAHGVPSGDVAWDARVTDEAAGRWLVTCSWPGGSASWEWSPLNRRARAADEMARELTDTREQIDDLTAVLRPLHTSRADTRPETQPRATVVPLPVPDAGSDLTVADQATAPADTGVEAMTEPLPVEGESVEEEPPAEAEPVAETSRAAPRRPKPAIPAWETILGTIPPRE